LSSPLTGLFLSLAFGRMTAAGVGPTKRPQEFVLASLLQQELPFSVENQHGKSPMKNSFTRMAFPPVFQT